MATGRFVRGAAALAAAFLMAVLPWSSAGAQDEGECADAVPTGTACEIGQDASGAFYLMAIPPNWNGILIVHAHDGPQLSEPSQEDNLQDLGRYAFLVREGYAWAVTTYRHGGYGVRMAAEDLDTLRRLFWERRGKPRRTILHGQAWGAKVAAKAIEAHGRDASGAAAFDGAVLTSGMLAGGARAYDFRLDLRVVYQFFCGNHPRPEERRYPLWRGLPLYSQMTRWDLVARIDECTGILAKPEDRTERQKRALANILNVIGITEPSLPVHLAWATFALQDLVQFRLNNRNPFGNEGVVYEGSDQDAALNAGVLRYRADPEAIAGLAEDGGLTGHVDMPVITLHAIDDPIAFVENETAYRDTLDRAGSGGNLVQVFTREAMHNKVSAPQYPTLFEVLLGWIEGGARPTPRDVAEACEAHAPAYGEPCRIDPDYRPRPYDARVPPRPRG